MKAIAAVVASLAGIAVAVAPVASAGDSAGPALRSLRSSNAHKHPIRYTQLRDPWAVKPDLPPYRRTATVLQVSAPTRVTVDAIGVHAPLVPLGLAPTGAMEVPTDFNAAGWYTGGPHPGENGPAVIAGHVDSRTGPAVFFRLQDLRPGDPIVVDRADGSRVTFAVDAVRRYAKASFATAKVFGPTTAPALRLVTCGGTFDRAKGHYRDNVVVFATVRP